MAKELNAVGSDLYAKIEASVKAAGNPLYRS